MADVRVEGAEKLRKLARDLSIAGNIELQKELRRGLAVAARPVGKEVRAEIPRVMPSGYAPVLSKALRVSVSTRTPRASRYLVAVRVVLSAAGRHRKRDLPALDRGSLRHPVFGRRRQPWVMQRIRRGFFAEPAKRTQDQATTEAIAAIERVADKLARG